jgi:DNA modification methylase
MYVAEIPEIQTFSDTRQVFKTLLQGNLDFNNDRKNQNQRHFWHPFPAKFPPQLPRVFIENMTEENDLVLDPMAGSCTTLIEAAELSRQTIGFDIDPLSLMLGNAKIGNISLEKARRIGLEILSLADFTHKTNKNLLEKTLEKRFDEETRKFVDYWFLPATQLELASLLLEIEKLEDKGLRNFLQLIFSGIIITKSGGVTMGRDLAHTRPHRVMEKVPNSALTEFGKRLVKLTSAEAGNFETGIELNQGNAKSLPLPDESVDLIITSPPYANNAIDYMRAHKFSLVWFGHEISTLKQIRQKYIGAEVALNGFEVQFPPHTAEIVNRLAFINKGKSKALGRYYTEMQAVISEMFRVLKPGKACAIVVASSVLCGIDVETHHCLAEIGQIEGFELVEIGERVIHRDSRMLPTSKNKSGSQIEARMHNEFIIGLLKPSIV